MSSRGDCSFVCIRRNVFPGKEVEDFVRWRGRGVDKRENKWKKKEKMLTDIAKTEAFFQFVLGNLVFICVCVLCEGGGKLIEKCVHIISFTERKEGVGAGDRGAKINQKNNS